MRLRDRVVPKQKTEMVDRVEKTKMNFRGDTISTSAVDQDDMSVDWKGRPCKLNKHGGMTAAVFVLGLSLFLSCSL